VLHLAFSGWHDGIDFDVSSFGASESVPNLNSLVPTLQSPAESSKNRNRMTVPFGAAAPRVADQVKDLLQL